MVAAHLLEHRKDLFLLLLGDAPPNQSREDVFIRINIRRQPSATPEKSPIDLGAALFKGLAAEYPDEAGEIDCILMWIWVQPAGCGVPAKSQHHCTEGLIRT